jgi:hypothetical protein
VHFLGIFDRHIPSSTVSEFLLDVAGTIASTENQLANALAAQLPDEHFEKWPVTN